jgi:excisionase family DNA binding protein
MMEQYLRVHEVASRVRKDVSSIRRAIAKGQLGFRRCGRILLIPESELSRILGEYHPPVRHVGEMEPQRNGPVGSRVAFKSEQ